MGNVMVEVLRSPQIIQTTSSSSQDQQFSKKKDFLCLDDEVDLDRNQEGQEEDETCFLPTSSIAVHLVDPDRMGACSFYNRRESVRDLVRLSKLFFFIFRRLLVPVVQRVVELKRPIALVLRTKVAAGKPREQEINARIARSRSSAEGRHDMKVQVGTPTLAANVGQPSSTSDPGKVKAPTSSKTYINYPLWWIFVEQPLASYYPNGVDPVESGGPLSTKMPSFDLSFLSRLPMLPNMGRIFDFETGTRPPPRTSVVSEILELVLAATQNVELHKGATIVSAADQAIASAAGLFTTMIPIGRRAHRMFGEKKPPTSTSEEEDWLEARRAEMVDALEETMLGIEKWLEAYGERTSWNTTSSSKTRRAGAGAGKSRTTTTRSPNRTQHQNNRQEEEQVAEESAESDAPKQNKAVMKKSGWHHLAILWPHGLAHRRQVREALQRAPGFSLLREQELRFSSEEGLVAPSPQRIESRTSKSPDFHDPPLLPLPQLLRRHRRNLAGICPHMQSSLVDFAQLLYEGHMLARTEGEQFHERRHILHKANQMSKWVETKWRDECYNVTMLVVKTLNSTTSSASASSFSQKVEDDDRECDRFQIQLAENHYETSIPSRSYSTSTSTRSFCDSAYAAVAFTVYDELPEPAKATRIFGEGLLNKRLDDLKRKMRNTFNGNFLHTTDGPDEWARLKHLSLLGVQDF
ncbi:unnamed protein product [Amoebophrya sp. A25]|nr:unnamed protein product [Amoebophrya sp. A25]|eukprot:GSA25T00017139001.1